MIINMKKSIGILPGIEMMRTMKIKYLTMKLTITLN